MLASLLIHDLSMRLYIGYETTFNGIYNMTFLMEHDHLVIDFPSKKMWNSTNSEPLLNPVSHAAE
jgi:hypothetical protein